GALQSCQREVHVRCRARNFRHDFHIAIFFSMLSILRRRNCGGSAHAAIAGPAARRIAHVAKLRSPPSLARPITGCRGLPSRLMKRLAASGACSRGYS
ncbi:MAG: hypothetical protein LBJ10_03330, partial [Clostridiales bacterium]|nr:hypothetical protein [Clostridiales bacterium]